MVAALAAPAAAQAASFSGGGTPSVLQKLVVATPAGGAFGNSASLKSRVVGFTLK